MVCIGGYRGQPRALHHRGHDLRRLGRAAGQGRDRGGCPGRCRRRPARSAPRSPGPRAARWPTPRSSTRPTGRRRAPAPWRRRASRSPRNSVPSSGDWEMTSPSSTVSLFSLVAVTLRPSFFSARVASSASFPVKSRTLTGRGPLLTTTSTTPALRSRVACLRVGAQHHALGHLLGVAVGRLPVGQRRVRDRGLGLVEGQPGERRHRVPLGAAGQDRGDGAVAGHVLPAGGVGAHHRAGRDRLGVGPAGDVERQSGAPPPWPRADPGGQVDHAGCRGEATLAEPPAARARRSGQQQHDHQQQRSAPRPASARRPGGRLATCSASIALGAARRDHAGVVGARRRARPAPGSGSSASAPARRARSRCRRLPSRCTGTVGVRSEVSSGSSATPWSRATLTRRTWCSSTCASAGRRSRSRAVARATSASTYGGMPATIREGGGHVLVDVLVGDLDRGVALVRLAAGEHLVEHDAGGVHVRAGVGAAVDDELGREVGHRADQHAAGRGVLGLGADRAGQPEVGDLDAAVVGEQDVLGLHVAVDDAGVVGGGERGEHRLDERQRLGGRHRGLARGSRRAGCGRGRTPWPGTAVPSSSPWSKTGHHVRVREPGGGAGLPHEPAGEVVVVAEPGVHHLERAGPVQPQVDGLVDGGHPAAGDRGHRRGSDRRAPARSSGPRQSCPRRSSSVCGRARGKYPAQRPDSRSPRRVARARAAVGVARLTAARAAHGPCA